MILSITGGTGSLGASVLNHQEYLKSKGITRIQIISRDEMKQEMLEKAYSGDIEIQCILADIRNKDRIEFAIKNSHFLIHAAALKIVPRIEYDVPEATLTNIQGTENVLRAFLQSTNAISGIMVSTDKAVDPVNAYGFSKAFAERVWLWGMMIQNEVKLSVCRYGNVFGSRGSVLWTWYEAFQKSKPLSMTDPYCTRFFISLHEASLFVLEQLFNNKGGEVVIPYMNSITMNNLGAMLSMMEGKEFNFESTGLREGEKVHEVLTSINDSYFYGEDNKKWIILRPLTEKLRAYHEYSRHKFKIDKPISSYDSNPISEAQLREYYTEWKNQFLL